MIGSPWGIPDPAAMAASPHVREVVADYVDPKKGVPLYGTAGILLRFVAGELSPHTATLLLELQRDLFLDELLALLSPRARKGPQAGGLISSPSSTARPGAGARRYSTRP